MEEESWSYEIEKANDIRKIERRNKTKYIT